MRARDETSRGAPSTLGAAIRRLLVTWFVLLLLGAAELALSFIHLARSLRPLVAIPGVLMAIVVVVGFMEVRRGPVIIRAFAVGAGFWLLVLLILGSVDPLTRIDCYVPR